VADYGTDTISSRNEDFLDSVNSVESTRVAPPFPPLLSLAPEWIFLPRHALNQERTMSDGYAQPILLCPSFADNEKMVVQEC
jgi:hypothetical protein